jgi:hypothetical protein
MKSLILSALFTLPAFAQDYNLKCVASYNSEKVFEQELLLSQGQRALKFGSVEDFDFILSSNKDQTVELQVLNVNEPSRSYATAKLKEKDAYVELSIWKREFLLEVRCTVN